MEELWIFGQEKQLSVQNLWSCCERLEEKIAEGDTMKTCLVTVHREAKTLLKPFICYFELRICGIWSTGAD